MYFYDVNFRKFNDKDCEIIMLVGDKIKNLKIRKPRLQKSSLERKNMLLSSLDIFKEYDADILDRVNNLYSTIKIVDSPFNIERGCRHDFITNQFGQILDNSIKLTCLYLPREIYLSDIIWYSHEMIHALKDSNYNEFINCYKYGEILPLFHEIFLSNKISNLVVYNEWIQLRYVYLKENNERMDIPLMMDNHNYNILLDCLLNEKQIKDKQLLNCNNGCYLLSYYYALLLYNLYLDNPNKILHIISKVLRKEVTTEYLLNELDIIENNTTNNKIFNITHNSLTKILK